MNYIVEINSENEDKLNKLGKITYKSKMLNGLYFIESELEIQKIQEYDFIKTVSNERTGTLNV